MQVVWEQLGTVFEEQIFLKAFGIFYDTLSYFESSLHNTSLYMILVVFFLWYVFLEDVYHSIVRVAYFDSCVNSNSTVIKLLTPAQHNLLLQLLHSTPMDSPPTGPVMRSCDGFIIDAPKQNFHETVQMPKVWEAIPLVWFHCKWIHFLVSNFLMSHVMGSQVRWCDFATLSKMPMMILHSLPEEYIRSLHSDMNYVSRNHSECMGSDVGMIYKTERHKMRSQLLHWARCYGLKVTSNYTTSSLRRFNINVI